MWGSTPAEHYALHWLTFGSTPCVRGQRPWVLRGTFTSLCVSVCLSWYTCPTAYHNPCHGMWNSQLLEEIGPVHLPIRNWDIPQGPYTPQHWASVADIGVRSPPLSHPRCSRFFLSKEKMTAKLRPRFHVSWPKTWVSSVRLCITNEYI